jgi:TM2 domain-containing membrane protein YozV
MIGQVQSYDPESLVGVITSEDKLFDFVIKDWVAGVPPEQEDEVYFDVENNQAVNVRLVGAYLEPPKAVKSKVIAGCLALFLGFAGVHRIYLGFYKLAVAQMALTAATVGFGAVWGLIDALLIFTGNINKDGKGRPLK